MRRAILLAAAVATISAPAHAQSADPDPWLGKDKALHFGASAVIAGGTYAIAATQFRARWPPLVIGGSVAIAVGAAKEGLDALGFGDPSWKDFTWDVIGAVAGLGIAWGIDLLVRGVDEHHPLVALPSAGPAGFAIRF